MDLSTAIYLTTAAMIAVLVGVVMVTRRFLRRPGPGEAAMAELAAELRRANDLAERRVGALEERVRRLEGR